MADSLVAQDHFGQPTHPYDGHQRNHSYDTTLEKIGFLDLFLFVIAELLIVVKFVITHIQHMEITIHI